MLSRRDVSGTAVVEADPAPLAAGPGPVRRTLRRVTTHGVHLASNLLGDDVVGRRARVALLRTAGADVAGGVTVCGGTYVSHPARLVIGTGGHVGRSCYLDLEARIVLGDRVTLGHGVSLITTKHRLGPAELRCGTYHGEEVRIGDGVWVGANATILPGVSVGSGAVVAAGAVVTSDVAPNTLVAGSPARAIRSLD